METEDPQATALMEAGIAALDSRSFTAALAVYDVLVEEMPAYAEAWNKRATAHYLVGDYEASLADIERTLALEPRHFGALSGRGLIQHARGDDLAAIESFEAALAIHPNLVSVRRNLEALKARQKPI
jgi:tetratricopeptide (TPR) repeat protein